MADRIAVMDRGQLQQYGSPDDLYERPGQHVRGALHRLGAEQLPRRALRRRRRCTSATGASTSASAAASSRAATSATGLTATIRPERVRVVEAGSADATISAQVTLVEPLGPKDVVHLEYQGTDVRVVLPPDARPSIGSALGLHFDPGAGARLRRRHRTGGALMARVRLEGVSKRFGTVTAMDDVTLDIADGEFFAILGPPGAGKTTTLRAILGLEKPDSGRVLLDDEDVTDVWPGDRDIAIVFQNLALYPDKTVFGNLAFPLKQRKLPKSEIAERVQRAAKVLKIEPLLDRKPAKLSGGERQRVAIGRAIVRDPRAYLFDEPLSALDALLRLEMRSELKYLQRDLNRTLVYVTHDQVEAMSMADRMAVLRDGAVQQVATPEDIYHRPVNRFVATTIGSPPMNFLPATARRQNGARHGRARELHRPRGGRPRRARGRRALLRRHPPRGRPRAAGRGRHRGERVRDRAARRRDRRRPAPRRPRRQGARAADGALRRRRGGADLVRPAAPAHLRRRRDSRSHPPPAKPSSRSAYRPAENSGEGACRAVARGRGPPTAPDVWPSPAPERLSEVHVARRSIRSSRDSSARQPARRRARGRRALVDRLARADGRDRPPGQPADARSRDRRRRPPRLPAERDGAQPQDAVGRGHRHARAVAPQPVLEPDDARRRAARLGA